MKTYLKQGAIILVFILGSQLLHAQRQIPIAINLYGAYVFPDRMDLGYYNSYSSYGQIQGNGQYGAGIEFFLNPLRSLELSYQYMGTTAQFYNYSGQTNKNDDRASAQYILIGGNNYFHTGGNVEPYGGAGIGLGIVNYNYGQGGTSESKFAWNIHLGVKINTASAVSLKLQAFLQSVAQGVGVGVGFGTGGAGAGVTTYSSMLQFGLGGAISFTTGKHHQ